MPARISEIGMIETWRGGAIVTGAVVDAGAAAALEAAALGEAWAVEKESAATASGSRGSSRAVGRSNIGSSVRGVPQRVKRSFFFLETSAWILWERALE